MVKIIKKIIVQLEALTRLNVFDDGFVRFPNLFCTSLDFFIDPNAYNGKFHYESKNFENTRLLKQKNGVSKVTKTTMNSKNKIK